MGLLSPGQLATIRRQAASSLDQVCVIRTYAAEAVDVEGGTTLVLLSTENVDCRKATPTGTEREIASRLGKEVDAMFTLPYGTVVADTAQIDDGDGVAYEVVLANLGQSYKTAVRVAGKLLA